MKRTSTSIYITSPGSETLLPWLGSEPDFTGIKEPTLSILQLAWEEGKDTIEVIPDPEPFIVVMPPDWDALQSSLLGGELYFIYQRIRAASFATTVEGVLLANNISTALGFITDGILTVRIEPAIAEAIELLKSIGYTFTDEEKDIWNTTVTELNFSSQMFI